MCGDRHEGWSQCFGVSKAATLQIRESPEKPADAFAARHCGRESMEGKLLVVVALGAVGFCVRRLGGNGKAKGGKDGADAAPASPAPASVGDAIPASPKTPTFSSGRRPSSRRTSAIGADANLDVRRQSTITPYFYRKSPMTKSQVVVLNKYREKCVLSGADLNAMADDFVSRMEEGLKKDSAMLKMLPSYVDRMPSGSESGEFLAIDLGGTNVRVVKVILLDGEVADVQSYENAIPPERMVGSIESLFNFIATEVSAFLKKVKRKKGYEKARIPIGFTFSYPMKQTSLRSAEIVCWTKGFDIKDAGGKDLVCLLEKSLSKYKVNARVEAILNDTVGTLALSKFEDSFTRVGLILGTGSNAAYVERCSSIPKLADEYAASEVETVVNIEWGNFKSDFLPRLPEDDAVDASTPNPGSQPFEKMIAGMYLGELVRRICCQAVSDRILLEGSGAALKSLEAPGAFPTTLVSQIEGYGIAGLAKIKSTLESVLGVSGVTDNDGRFIHEVCSLIGMRSARLAAAGVVAIRKHLLNTKAVGAGGHFVVAIDGSLYEKYPCYHERMMDAVEDMIGAQSECVSMFHAPDGSGLGAAVVAASNGKSAAFYI